MLGKPSNEPNPRNANHLLVGYIPVRAVRRARGRRALREDADLERLYAVADAGRAGAGLATSIWTIPGGTAPLP